MTPTLTIIHNVCIDGVVRPGESVPVNLVCVDETHIFQHAEDTLQTHTTTGSVTSVSYLRVCLIHFVSLIFFSLKPLIITMGVVSSSRERGVYVNSAKQGWISFTGSIPVTSILVTSSSETCGMSHIDGMILTVSGNTTSTLQCFSVHK